MTGLDPSLSFPSSLSLLDPPPVNFRIPDHHPPTVFTPSLPYPHGPELKTFVDRSCAKCRLRKVRCDRAGPSCLRCIRRKEKCIYPDDSTFEDVSQIDPDSEDRAKIRELELRLQNLQARLTSREQGTPSVAVARPSSCQPPFFIPDVASRIYVAVTSAFAGGLGTAQGVLDEFLTTKTTARGEVELLQRELVASLVEAAVASASADFPAFKSLHSMVGKLALRSPTTSFAGLSLRVQVALVVLCTLGARAARDSRLFGVYLDAASASPELLVLVGEQRERVCERLLDLAVQACWSQVLLSSSLVGELEEVAGAAHGAAAGGLAGRAALPVLMGVCQLLVVEGGQWPIARWFLRYSVGLYEDLELEATLEPSVGDIRITLVPIIFSLDATISSQLLTPSLLRPSGFLDQTTFTEHTSSMTLAQLVQRLMGSSTASVIDVQQVIGAAACAISCCEREFGNIGSTSSPLSATLLSLRALWASIDKVHVEVQHLQRLFFGSDAYLRESVRLDSRLLGLCLLMHTFLGPGHLRELVGGVELAVARGESELRIRKSLKLFAFYAKVLLSSYYELEVHDLVKLLQFLPEWPTLARQRVGDIAGPTTSEFEVSDSEVDWLVTALKRASFYSRFPAQKLAELSAFWELGRVWPMDE